jgi:cysteine desulfurase
LSDAIYLDWNATAPPRDDVLEAMRDAARIAWANPSSIHRLGRDARRIVEDGRALVAALASADPRDVVFTSGGTEANNLAIRSLLRHARAARSEENGPGAARARPPAEAELPRVVTSRLEHPSVTRVVEALEADGEAHVAWLPVRPEGSIALDALEAALASSGTRVALVALQAVNHETGVVQPVAEAIALARAHGARVHVDAVQAFGKVPVTWSGADTISIAAHKLGGPKGVGALVFRPGVKLEPLLVGGAQERGLRPGTVDPIAAAGFGVAARAAADGAARYAELAPLRDRIEAAVLDACPGARVNGEGMRAPHVTNLALPGWNGPELVAALDLEGVCVSSGSACSAGTVEASPVIASMHGAERARSSIRVSLGDRTGDDAIERAVAAFRRVLARGRA